MNGDPVLQKSTTYGELRRLFVSPGKLLDVEVRQYKLVP